MEEEFDRKRGPPRLLKKTLNWTIPYRFFLHKMHSLFIIRNKEGYKICTSGCRKVYVVKSKDFSIATQLVSYNANSRPTYVPPSYSNTYLFTKKHVTDPILETLQKQ